MASVLNKFEEKTKILASKVNQNFEMLQSDISTLDEEIDFKLNSTKESILSDVETVKSSLESGKADINLTNIEASQNFIDNVFNWLAPDFENIIEVKSLPYTAPSYGYWRHFGLNRTGSININENLLDTYSWADNNWPGHQSITILLSPGDVISKKSGSVPYYMRFIPCKGISLGKVEENDE